MARIAPVAAKPSGARQVAPNEDARLLPAIAQSTVVNDPPAPDRRSDDQQVATVGALHLAG